MAKQLSQDDIVRFAEEFAALARQSGWNVDVMKAWNRTDPEEIVVLTVRFGKKTERRVHTSRRGKPNSVPGELVA